MPRIFFGLLVLILFSGEAWSQNAQGGIQGKVLDQLTKESLPYASIVLFQNGIQVLGTISDSNGVFELTPLSPGTYDIKVLYVGYANLTVSKVVVTGLKTTFIDLKMSLDSMDPVIIKYEEPPLSKDETSIIRKLDSADWSAVTIRNPSDAATLTSDVYSADDGSGNFSVRGERADANGYMVDGVWVPGRPNLGKGAVSDVSVLTGGIPAAYGDVTGGVVSITTRGPAAKYSGSIEVLSSGFGINNQVYGLDQFGHNIVEATLAGPLILKEDTNGNKSIPVMGFFLSGNYTNQVDARPSAIGVDKVKDEVLQDLIQNPITIQPGFGQTIQNAELLTQESFENVATKQNVGNQSYSLNGKLDTKLGNHVRLTFGGAYDAYSRRAFSYTNSLYNSHNNALQEGNNWRAFGRLMYNVDDPNKPYKGTFSKTFYSIQFAYNESNASTMDARHQEDLFNYGYVGQFTRFQDRQYEVRTLTDPGEGSRTDSLYLGSDIGWVYSGDYIVQTAFEDTLVGFIPGNVNPEMAAFTTNYYKIFGWEGYDEQGNPIYDAGKASLDQNGDGQITGDERNYYLRNPENIQNGGGYLNGDAAQTVYGLWNSHAAVNNGVGKSKSQRYRININGSSRIANHSVSAGFEYEQRDIRGYNISPRGLWTFGALRTNSHLTELDLMNPIISTDNTLTRVSYDRLNAAPGEYGGEVNEDAQSFFDYNLRKSLGLDPDGNDFVDMNSLSPDQLKLEYFSPNELLNNGNSLVSYFGYDAYGNLVNDEVSINDFLTETDANGNYTRPIASFRPNYTAGWIQDKYKFDDLIFTVGVRIDRLDLNQEVLRDPYVLFPTVRAGEAEVNRIAEGMEGGYSVPGNIQDNYVVYVDNVENPQEIVGYRNQDTWYNAEGIEIANGDALQGASGKVSPLLVDKNNTRSSDITSASFVDYTPQVNVMPRIAFSFPINEEAIFFAHYDVLTRRPTANGIETAARLNIADYYFLDASSSGVISNPNLKPSQTIDYAMGFKQMLTKKSVLTLEAFYREQRNMIQVVGLQNAYPVSYTTYGNIDFGTVKGLVATYDMHRTNNLRLNVSYTLLFAAGTGSDAFSAQNLVRSGKQSLRNTSPLNNDQRHRIVGTIDYRFGLGDKYNGPKTAKKILQGMGLNTTFFAGSGTPYSRQNFVTGEAFIQPVGSATLNGSVNGSRLPWQFKMDIKLDKTFYLKRKDHADLRMNAYFQMQNVLNSVNVRSVYRFTGTANDDGYLTDATYQNDIQGQTSEQAFRDQYAMKVQSPWNYNLPRRTMIGIMMMF